MSQTTLTTYSSDKMDKIDLSKDTLRKAYKIRDELNKCAKQNNSDKRFSLNEVISEALDHYSDFKVIDL